MKQFPLQRSDRRVTTFFVCILCALALALGGCGGYSDSGDGPIQQNDSSSDVSGSGTDGDTDGLVTAGHEIYDQQCSSCHGQAGVVTSSNGQSGASAQPLTELLTVSQLADQIAGHQASQMEQPCVGECAVNVATYIHYAFVEPVHFPNDAEDLYQEQCATCHIVNGGQPPSLDLSTLECTNCNTLEGLGGYIAATMPVENAASCGPECGRELAKFIMAGFDEVPYLSEEDSGELSAAFTLSSNSGVAPLPVRLDASASTGTDLQYQWTISSPNGFASSATGRIAALNLTDAGTYIITLSVVDRDNAIERVSQTLAVSANEACPSIETYFAEQAWPIFRDTCATCHTDEGNAAASRLVIDENSEANSYRDILTYGSDQFGGRTGYSLLMDKPMQANGVNHGGFTQITDGSVDYYRLYNLSQMIANQDQCEQDNNQPPVALFSSSTVSGEAPLLVSFDASSSVDPEGGSLNYRWDLDNGVVASGANVMHIFQEGVHIVELTVTDSQGLTSTRATTIQATASQSSNESPVADAVISTSNTINIGTEVYFDGAGSTDDGSIVNYLWSMGNGDVVQNQSFSYTFTQVGRYSVQLIVTDNEGASDSTFVVIDVVQPNRAPSIDSIVASATSGEAPLIVEFSATTSDLDGDALSYEWSRGGQSSNNESWAQSFTEAGTYTVSLEIDDASGGTDTDQVTVTVSEPSTCQLPEEYFETAAWSVFRDTCALCHTDSGLASGSGLVFSDTDDDAAFSSIAAYARENHDGSTGYDLLLNKSAQLNGVSHGGSDAVYPGTTDYYLVSNLKDLFADEADCRESRNRPPVAQITSNYVRGPAQLSVSLSATSSSDPDSDTLTYSWSLDGSLLSNNAEVDYLFPEGSHTVQLTVTDPYGESDSDTLSVIVDPSESMDEPPVADTSATASNTTNVGVALSFDASNSTDDNGIASYNWDFGNGASRSRRAVNYTYTTAGVYTVQLTVTDTAGQMATSNMQVTVIQPNRAPVISTINSTGSGGVAPYALGVSASVSDADGDDLTYLWEANGLSSNAETWALNFGIAGTQTISLTVTDPDGASAQEDINVTVTAPDNCVLPQEQFAAQSMPLFRDTCADCHTSGGSARNSSLVFSINSEAEAFSDIADYARNQWFGAEGYQLLVDKPAEQNGVGHGGSVQAAVGTYSYYLLNNLSELFAGEADCIAGRNLKPIAEISSDYARAPAPLTVSFSGSSSSDPEGADLTYLWQFGDGSQSSQISPSHLFVEGVYTVTLTVTDNFGQTDSDTLVVVVDAAVSNNEAPVANADSTAPRAVNVGDTVQFDASQSTDDAGITSYAWDFGDGNNAVGITRSHSYSNPGNFTATLTVTDEEGLTDQATVSISVTRPVAYTCDNIELAFADLIQPEVSSGCIACHAAGEAADDGSVDMLFSQGQTSAQMAAVFDAEALQDIGGQSRVMVKAKGGNAHLGGVQIIDDSSTDQDWQEYVDLLWACNGQSSGGDGGLEEFYDDVEYASNEQVFYRASIVLRGIAPTAAEYALLGSGTENELRTALRSIMAGEGFRDFIKVGINDKILTNRALMFDRVYEDLYDRHTMFSSEDNNNFDSNRFPGSTYTWINDDIVAFQLAQEPLELVHYIVSNDRDYREILTADYTVANEIIYSVEGGNSALQLINPDTGSAGGSAPSSRDDWVPVKYKPGFYSGGYDSSTPTVDFPHAGIVTQKPWLLRHPTTSSNINRHRGRMIMAEFLDFDVQNLGRPEIDEDDLVDSENPTFFNPACKGCHEILDPVAGAFQNFDEWARYRGGNEYFGSPEIRARTDALHEVYKYGTTEDCRFDTGNPQGEGGYCDDDLWLATVVPTGFLREGDAEVTLMPDDGPGRNGAHDDASLQWLTKEITNDPRFIRGSVVTWYETVFNLQVLTEPAVSDPLYTTRKVAYDAQEQFFDEVGAYFAQDNGNGVYNLKDLLVAMFLSDMFRAENFDGDTEKTVEHRNLGVGSILTPEQLHRRLEGSLGVGWNVRVTSSAKMNRFIRCGDTYKDWDQLDEPNCYAILYGGIDSDSVTERVETVNSIMVKISERVALEVSCPAVRNDFDRSNTDRYLFKDMNSSWTPSSHPTQIRQNIQLWMEKLWGETHAVDSSEVQGAFDLLESLWQMEQSANQTRVCDEGDNLEGWNDSNHMKRAWADLLVYFMTDYKFLHLN